MTKTTVASIVPGAVNLIFGEITAVFASKADEYAVYRTDGRLLIQYADEPSLEAKQRTALAPLGPLRSEINTLIDGWRQESWHRTQHTIDKVAGLDRGTADGLVLALESDNAGALIQLNRVRNAIIDDRTSLARFVYLTIALGFVVLASAVIGVLASRSWQIPGTSVGGDAVTTAILGGLGGSFFSIATGLSKRTILPDSVSLGNMLDAVLRMMIGMISAAILICLLRANLGMTLVFANPPASAALPSAPVPWMQLVALGFVAGFSERLVPDLLAKAGQAVQTTALPPPPPLPVAPPPPPDIKERAAPPPSPPPAPPETGDCASDAPLTEAETTLDAALPAAMGGAK